MNILCKSVFVLNLLPFIRGNPVGCSYETSTLLYTCSMRYWSLPLQFTDFTVQPQRILLNDVSGELPGTAPLGPTFTGFSAINTATFDSRYSPSLTIMCLASGFLIITKDTFEDFGFVEEVAITDCDILSVPVSVFQHIGTLNSFQIYGGSITNMVADSFRSLNVIKITSAPQPKGEFVIRDSVVTSGQLPFGVLYNVANASSVVLDGLQLTSISKDTFYGIPNIKNITLNHNNFTSIPSFLFSGLHSLSHVSMWGVSWSCTCDNLWFIPFAIENNLTLTGDFICSLPSGYANKRAVSFYATNCLKYDICNGELGIVIQETCLKAIDIVSYGLFVPILVMTGISLTIIIYLCRRKTQIRKYFEEEVIVVEESRESKFAKLMQQKMDQNDHEFEPKSYKGNFLNAKRKLALMIALSKGGRKVTPETGNENTDSQNTGNDLDDVSYPTKTNPVENGIDEMYNDNIDDYVGFNNDIDNDDGSIDLADLRNDRLNRALEDKLKALENVHPVSGIWVVPHRRKTTGLNF